MLDAETIQRAFEESARADLFLSVGTSALVQPAASLPVEAKHAGAKLVEINPDETPLTFMADYHIGEPSGQCLPRLLAALEAAVH